MTRERKDGMHSLRLRVSWHGMRLEHYLASAISAEGWDKKLCKPKKTERRALRELEELTVAVDRLFDQCSLDGRIPAENDVRKALGGDACGTAGTGKTLLVDAMEMLSNDSEIGGAWAHSTRCSFRSVMKKVQGWNEKQNLEDFDRKAMSSFMDYCFEHGMINSSVMKFLERIRWVMKTAAERGMCSPSDAIGFRPRYKPDSENEVVYISKDEMQRMLALDLSGNQCMEEVRDLFLFCCFSGLRFSDAVKLRGADVRDGYIRVVTKKTKSDLNIELNNATSAILDKYDDGSGDNNRLCLPAVSNDKMNGYLKKLAVMAKIDEPVSRVWWVRAERHEKCRPKHDVISSHVGRKTFVVNALTLNIASEVVMKWTGHKSHQVMKRYVAIVDDLKKREMTKFDSLANDINFSRTRKAPEIVTDNDVIVSVE